jgi:O-antigen/teichoic acid export membrane protein
MTPEPGVSWFGRGPRLSPRSPVASGPATGHRAGTLSGRVAWSITDQAAASLGTLGLSIIVARTSDVAGFGAYATVFIAYALALSGIRALLAMPYQMRLKQSSQPPSASGLLGAVVVVAVLSSIAFAVTGLLIGGPMRLYLLIFAVALPALLLQDAYRFVLLYQQGPRAVALNDSCWTTVQLIGSALVAMTRGHAAPLHVAAWGLGAAVAAGWGWQRSGCVPSLTRAPRFFRDTRRTGGPLLVETLAISGSGSASSFAVAAVGGLTAVAPLRGAGVLLGPVSVLTGGLLLLATPVMLSTGAADRGLLLRRCAGYGAVVAGACIAAVLAVLLLPAQWGEALLGATWSESRPVVLPVGLAVAVYGLETAAMLGFRAHGIAVRTMVLRLSTFPLPAAAAVIGLHAGGPAGAAYGMAFAAIVTATGLWWMLARLPARPTAEDPHSDGPVEDPS